MLTSQMHRPPRNHMPEEFVLTERRRPFKQGASDFLSSPLDSHELISTIARAYCVHYDIESSALFDSTEDIVAGLTRLTERERQVLDLLIEGQSTRGISDHLGIRVKTVEAHRSRVNDKMRTRDVAHLLRMYYALPEAELV